MKDLKTLRIEHNLTQSELAIQSELTNISICNVESRKTAPQHDVRHRLEICLGQRVNWLLTCGLEETKDKTWETIESDFRHAVCNIDALTTNEKQQFINVARTYIDTFEQLIEQADITEDEEILLPIDFSVLKGNRKRNINQ